MPPFDTRFHSCGGLVANSHPPVHGSILSRLLPSREQQRKNREAPEGLSSSRWAFFCVPTSRPCEVIFNLMIPLSAELYTHELDTVSLASQWSIDQAVEDALDGCRSGAHNIILRNAALRPGFHPCLSRHADGIELDMLD